MTIMTQKQNDNAYTMQLNVRCICVGLSQYIGKQLMHARFASLTEMRVKMMKGTRMKAVVTVTVLPTTLSPLRHSNGNETMVRGTVYIALVGGRVT